MLLQNNTIIEEEESRKTLSVKFIFQDNDNWHNYCKTYPLREVELKEVEKMLSCKGIERGCFIYSCLNCGKDLIVPFGCN